MRRPTCVVRPGHSLPQTTQTAPYFSLQWSLRFGGTLGTTPPGLDGCVLSGSLRTVLLLVLALENDCITHDCDSDFNQTLSAGRFCLRYHDVSTLYPMQGTKDKVDAETWVMYITGVGCVMAELTAGSLEQTLWPICLRRVYICCECLQNKQPIPRLASTF